MRTLPWETSAVCEGEEGQHHQHLDQHADDRGQRRTGPQTEQADRDGDGQFEEVGRADQGAGCRHVERIPRRAPRRGPRRRCRTMDQQWHDDKHDDERAVEDDLALKHKEKHHRHQQPDDRERLHTGLERVDRRLATLRNEAPACQVSPRAAAA